jgi:HEPN domain-containing protein
VDFNRTGRLRTPYEEFDEEDALEALEDCKKVVESVRKLIKEIK